MAKSVKQPAYSEKVGYFLDVSQAYLAILRTSGPALGSGICALSSAGRRQPVQQFQIGGEHVAR